MDTNEPAQTLSVKIKEAGKISTLGQSWVWLLGMFSLAAMTETIFFTQLRAFTPLYLPSLGISQSDVPRWTGLIASTTGLVGIPFLPLWGALADRYRRKPVIIRSYALFFLIAVILLLARNIWVFLCGWAISGLALGNTGLMMATLTERTPTNRQGLAITLMSSIASIGGLIGPILGGRIFDQAGFHTMLIVDAGLLAAVVVAMALGYSDDFQGAYRGPLLKMAGDSVKIIFKSAYLRWFFLALFFMFAGLAIAQTYVPLAIQTIYTGRDPGTVIGWVFGVSSLAAILINPLFGLLGDRWGYWRMLFLGAAIEVILWPIPALVKGVVPFAIAWALISGICSPVFNLSFTILARTTADEIRGRVMAFAYLPGNLGGFIGPTIGSVLTQMSVFAVFPAAAGFVITGILVFSIVYRQSRPVLK